SQHPADKREREAFAAKFIDQWAERNLSGPEMNPEAVASFKQRLTGGLGRYFGAGEDIMLSIYFDEFHATSVFHNEVPTFYSEWNRSPWAPVKGSQWYNLVYGE